jgi:hypothetical protein
MQSKIYAHNHFIGTANLQVSDETMGGLFGEFVPTEYYFDQIQQSVWAFWQAEKPDAATWHALRLNVQLAHGMFLFPQGGITIDDIRELPDAPKRIDIPGVDYSVIRDYILENPPRTFVEEPWEALTIGQKTGFEDELRKELGATQTSLFRFMANPPSHFLFDAEISAFCRNQRNDDVLFAIKKVDFDQHFALIHLTWTGKQEKDGYPHAAYYTDYDEFKHTVMYPDKAEWEE